VIAAGGVRKGVPAQVGAIAFGSLGVHMKTPELDPSEEEGNKEGSAMPTGLVRGFIIGPEGARRRRVKRPEEGRIGVGEKGGWRTVARKRSPDGGVACKGSGEVGMCVGMSVGGDRKGTCLEWPVGNVKLRRGNTAKGFPRTCGGPVAIIGGAELAKNGEDLNDKTRDPSERRSWVRRR